MSKKFFDVTFAVEEDHMLALRDSIRDAMNHADEEFKKFKEMERTGVSRFPISLDRYRTQWYALNNLDAALKQALEEGSQE